MRAGTSKRPVKGMHGRDHSPQVDVTLCTSVEVCLGQRLRLAPTPGSRSSPQGFGEPAVCGSPPNYLGLPASASVPRPTPCRARSSATMSRRQPLAAGSALRATEIRRIRAFVERRLRDRVDSLFLLIFFSNSAGQAVSIVDHFSARQFSWRLTLDYKLCHPPLRERIPNGSFDFSWSGNARSSGIS
jgi:hypothetical protein